MKRAFWAAEPPLFADAGTFSGMDRAPKPSDPDEMIAVPLDASVLEPSAAARLVMAAQKGDRRAADRLVRDHEGWVRSAIYSVTGRPDLVEDIAQQVWMQVWERIGSLKEPERLKPWLYSIARHAAIDAGMSAKRRKSRSGNLDESEDVPDVRNEAQPAHAAARGELRETLLQAVRGLPVLYREPFVLRHLEDWTYAQIGEVLDLPVETVETRLARARRMLREALHDKL